jgi:hypothetical protein
MISALQHLDCARRHRTLVLIVCARERKTTGKMSGREANKSGKRRNWTNY